MKLFLSISWVLVFITSYSQVDFLPAEFSTIGSSINSVASGDVNNDGLADAIVATTYLFDPEFDYHIFVYLQKPDGTLEDPEKYPYPETYGSHTIIKVADVNNDNLEDVVLGFDDSLGVYFQNASGLLDPLVSFHSGFDVDGIEVGDLNNDNLLDIAVCHWNMDYINVFYQSVNNNFIKESYQVESGGWDEIDVGDVNGDDLDDIVFMPGQSSEGSIIIFYQDSISGISHSHTVLNYEIEYHTRFNGIDIGDINNDGRNDIVGSIGGNTAWIALIFQDDAGNMGEATFIDSYDIPTPVEIGDLNCDGKNEIVVGHRAWSRFSVFEQDSLGNYNDYTLFGSLYYVNPYGLTLGDLNNDSRLDVLTTNGSNRAYFVYNRSAPETLLHTDTIVSYTTYEVDTVSSYTNTFYCNEIDSTGECFIQINNECTVTTTWVQYDVEGDSAIARSYELCGAYFEDTVHIEINYLTSIMEVDTSLVFMGIDTIFESYNLIDQYNVVDTIDMYTDHTEDTVVLEAFEYINDTLYIYTDSIFVQSYVLVIESEASFFEVYEGVYCGELTTDTLLAWLYPDTEIIILESDTTLISHTVTIYPSGINILSKEDRIRLFPNPASSYFRVECDFPVFLEVYSMHGELLKESDEKVIDISNLPNSTYIVLIKDRGKRLLVSHKLIKRK